MRVSKPTPVEVQWIPADRHPQLAADWADMEARAETSPFSSWAWASTWLGHIPDDCQPLVFRATDEQGLLGLALLVRSPARDLRRRLGGSVLYLQETGDSNIDRLTLEYGGLLARRGEEESAYAAFLAGLTKMRHWRSLRISASTHTQHVLAALPRRLLAYCAQRRPSYLVDLDAVRATQRGYIDSLASSNTRHKLRRTLRGYGAHGEVRMEVAEQPEQALAYLDELTHLHEKYWESKGRKGSFGDRFFRDFHRDFIGKHAATGLAQLSCIRAGELVVGYCYHLVWKNRVYYYNSGLNYGALQRHDQPGYLAHLAAIENYLAQGRASYDFLAGESNYKRALSTHANTMDWIVIKPRGWQLAADHALALLGARKRSVQALTLPGNVDWFAAKNDDIDA
ncbi:MAG: GNAT family N-acetyltransferase [Dokdonella sp.]